MNISAEEFSIKVDAPENLKEMKEKARDLDKLTYLIKEKFSNCSRDKKPVINDGSKLLINEENKRVFKVSAFAVKQARKLAAEKVFIELPSKKRGYVPKTTKSC